MKRFTMPLLAALAFVAIGVAGAAPAHAGNIVLRARGASDPPSGAAPRVESIGTHHKYVTANFPPGASETCTIFHFGLFNDYTPGADILGKIWFYTTGSSVTAVQWRADLRCVAPGSLGHDYDTVDIPNGLAVANLAPSGAANKHNGAQDLVLSGTWNEGALFCLSESPVIMRLCRTGADANPNTAKLIQVRLSW